MKKQALLIGINEYQILPELKYARQDAEAVEQALKQNYCFSDDEVMLLTDAKPGLFKPSNRRIIEKHLEKLAEQDLDLFIFGFWGHGLFRNGQRYFCPLDAISEDIEELGLSFDSLQRLFSNIRAKNTCMILDCCQKVHDRGEEDVLTAADQKVMENAARDIVLRRKETEPDFQSNVAILNSCKQGQAAYEWDSRKHGIFTAHLLDAMNRRFDSVAQIVGYISKNVEKTAMELGKTQTPFYKLEGDIFLPVDTKSSPLVTGDVFISYRHCNADLVAPIEEELKKLGISYFIDRVGVNYGMEYSEALTQAISDCKLLLLFWTPEVKGSDDIVKEVTLAQGLKKTVIPYKIGNFNITDHRRLCYHIAHLSRYEVPTQTQETVAELVNRIEQALTGKQSLQSDPPVISPNKLAVTIDSLSKQEEIDPLSNFLNEENQKKQKHIQNLLNEALESYKNEEYSKAIVPLEVILKLEPNSDNVKKLLSLCQSRLELQKIENERIKRATEEGQKQYEEVRNFNLPSQGTNAGERKAITIKGVEFAFRWCPAGAFMMGYEDDGKQHQVMLSKGFWIMETEVTQKQWKAIMGNNPSSFIGDDLPVEQVSWNDCQDFCRKCSMFGLSVQLPTEAQWEYACRAGSTTSYFWGNALNGDKANCDGNYPFGTSNIGAYLSQTTPVGSYDPNAWGLFDMHGNVWEWCQDLYGDYPSGKVIDPIGASNGFSRVIRGGSWYNSPALCRSGNRNKVISDNRSNIIGFRCVRNQ